MQACALQVLEILSHVNKRVRGHEQIKLPLEALLDLYLSSTSAPLVKNFAIVYVEMAMDRSSPQQQLAAVSCFHHDTHLGCMLSLLDWYLLAIYSLSKPIVCDCILGCIQAGNHAHVLICDCLWGAFKQENTHMCLCMLLQLICVFFFLEIFRHFTSTGLLKLHQTSNCQVPDLFSSIGMSAKYKSSTS